MVISDKNTGTETEPREAVAAEMPVFDFEEYSWKDSKHELKLREGLKKAMGSYDAEGIDAAFMGLQGLMAKALRSVPRSWLVKSAPPGLDWSKAESQDLVCGNKMQELMVAFQKAQSPDSLSGN